MSRTSRLFGPLFLSAGELLTSVGEGGESAALDSLGQADIGFISVDGYGSNRRCSVEVGHWRSTSAVTKRLRWHNLHHARRGGVVLHTTRLGTCNSPQGWRSDAIQFVKMERCLYAPMAAPLRPIVFKHGTSAV